MLSEIAARGTPLSIDAAALEARLPVHGLEDFIRWFESADALEGSFEGYMPMLEIHVERLVAQGVVYAELIVGSSEVPDGPDALDRMRAFRSWLDEREAGRIQMEIVLAVSRVRDVEEVRGVIDRRLALFDAGLLVGIAVAGWPEQGKPASRHREAIAMLRDRGVGIEIHAGEWAGPDSVWDALDAGADRIGHGVQAFADPRLLDAIGERGVHVEMCPTSNLKTGAIARIEDHVIGRARDLGLSFSINTDDPGPFQCSMASEHELVRRVFGFDDDDFARIAERSYRARFAAHKPPRFARVSSSGLP
jgi:adenosine deaminase